MNVRERMRELGGEDAIRFYEDGLKLQQGFSNQFADMFVDAIENHGRSGEQVMAAWLSALCEEYATAILTQYEGCIEPLGGDVGKSVQIGISLLVKNLNTGIANMAARKEGVEDQIKAAAKRGGEA